MPFGLGQRALGRLPRDTFNIARGRNAIHLLRQIKMRPSSSFHTASTRLAMSGRMIVCLLLVSGTAVMVLPNLAVVRGATVTTSTTTNAFPVSTDTPSYVGNATIVVSGVDASANGGISIVIANPKNNAVASQNVGVAQNGSFSATFLARWPVWNESGVYRVTVVAPIADFVGTPPTSYTSFNYTAVQPTSTGTSSTATSPNGAGDNGSSIPSILGVVGVIVVAVALVGFMLRSRGRRKPGTGAAPAKPAPKAQSP